MDLEGIDVLVLGLGLSGRSAAVFCGARGARVVAADERPASALEGLDALRAAPGVREVITGTAFPDPADFDLTVPSPGIPEARYRDRARVAWGDIELAARFLAVPIVAVTGTNGKSTTVRLIEAMLGGAGLRARAAGNVGTPALSLVGEALDVAVLEVSSFQLEATEALRPRVAVVLNVTPDHLDRHGDLAGYAAAKRRLLAQQGPDDLAVLSFDDPIVRGFADHTRGEVVPFSLREPLTAPAWRRAAWLDAGTAVLRDGETTRRIDIASIPLTGRHNLENVLAALVAAWVFGADPAAAARGAARFRGLPHRAEIVGTAGGMTWIDDSKATNPGAAMRALEGMSKRVVWIAGGRDKGLSYDELAAMAVERCARAILIGESAGKIEAALGGRLPCEHAGTIERAVETAAARGRPGDVVLLAPACSSFDQFTSFEERGARFRAAVEALGGREARQEETP
jgi:UDP-N-acetylmuramoylalanine--D-glutamate ligase